MKSATKHIVISTILCALTLVVFLAFYNRCRRLSPSTLILPELQILSWPLQLFVVFGVPVACVLLNLISGFTVRQKENAKPYMYYIMAVVAFVATGIHDLFGDEVNFPTRTLVAERLFFFEFHFEIFLNKDKECYVTNQELIQKLRCEKGCKQP